MVVATSSKNFEFAGFESFQLQDLLRDGRLAISKLQRQQIRDQQGPLAGLPGRDGGGTAFKLYGYKADDGAVCSRVLVL